MLRQCGLGIGERDAFCHRDAAEHGKALGGDLVEGEMRGSRARARKRHAAHLTHHLKLAILRPAAMQSEHKHAILRLGTVERISESPDPRAVGRERLLERPGMRDQRLAAHPMHRVVGLPEPEVGIGQRRMQSLRTGDRDKPFLVGAAEQNRSAHQCLLGLVCNCAGSCAGRV